MINLLLRDYLNGVCTPDPSSPSFSLRKGSLPAARGYGKGSGAVLVVTLGAEVWHVHYEKLNLRACMVGVLRNRLLNE